VNKHKSPAAVLFAAGLFSLVSSCISLHRLHTAWKADRTKGLEGFSYFALADNGFSLSKI